MRRRTRARDPRTLMEIRRLAYRAKRSEGNRQVFHDALLETWPEFYERSIEEAHRWANQSRETFYVYFLSRTWLVKPNFDHALGDNVRRHDLFFVTQIRGGLYYGVRVYAAQPKIGGWRPMIS